MKIYMKNFLYVIIFYLILLIQGQAEVLKKFEVQGNSRISTETLKVYGEIELNKDYSSDDINEIIKKLYETKFFSNISANFSTINCPWVKQLVSIIFFSLAYLITSAKLFVFPSSSFAGWTNRQYFLGSFGFLIFCLWMSYCYCTVFFQK